MDRLTFIYQGKTYVDNSPPPRRATIIPDVQRRSINDVPVHPGVMDMARTAKSKVIPPVAEPTSFSAFCKANGIDGAKARLKLRAAGYRAPYDMTDKQQLEIVKSLMR
jgi:hypothetical protein